MSMHQFQSFVDVGLPRVSERLFVPRIPLARSALRVAQGCWQVFKDEARARRAARDLSDVSDATLRDVGLERAEIERRVREG